MMAPRRACRYTGKTETAKDMDRSMGVFFLIANCPCEYIYIKPPAAIASRKIRMPRNIIPFFFMSRIF